MSDFIQHFAAQVQHEIPLNYLRDDLQVEIKRLLEVVIADEFPDGEVPAGLMDNVLQSSENLTGLWEVPKIGQVLQDRPDIVETHLSTRQGS